MLATIRAEDGKKHEEAEVVVNHRLHKMGEKKLPKSQERQNGNHFKRVKDLPSGILHWRK